MLFYILLQVIIQIIREKKVCSVTRNKNIFCTPIAVKLIIHILYPISTVLKLKSIMGAGMTHSVQQPSYQLCYRIIGFRFRRGERNFSFPFRVQTDPNSRHWVPSHYFLFQKCLRKKRYGGGGNRRKLHNQEVRDVCSSFNIVTKLN